MNESRQAEIVCSSGQNLMLLGVSANGAVKGRLLSMTLQQRFRNVTDANTEISYTFPLPFGAVLMGVDVELNGEQLKGEVTARSAARARYEEAISDGHSSIMLERNADQSYTLDLGNLMAREECGITVRYAQVLRQEHGQVRLMLPTTIAPRYGNPVTQGRLQPHQATVTDITAEYPFDISLTLYGDLAKANVASPSHRTGYQPNGDELVVRLAQRGALDRDFILTMSDLQNQSSAISCEDACVAGQIALMVSFSPTLERSADHHVSAKILVDCSGSMGGDSITAARNALRRIVEGLGSSDKFSLSRFGSTVEHRSKGLWSGTKQAKASANRWIDSLEADLGGTEMAAALTSTIAISHGGSSDILLVTDGEIHGIDEVIEVATQAGHRVFVVAIGASPAEVHLRRLANATGGACDFVAPGEDVEPSVLRMFSRMRSSRATNLRVDWPASASVKWAQKSPDFAFGNDTLNLYAFVEIQDLAIQSEVVRLLGCLDESPDEVVLAQAEIVPVESTVNTLARVAAHAQYSEQSAAGKSLRVAAGLSTSQEIAVKYQLVTEETNFILVHERAEEDRATEMPAAHKVSQMMPAGWGGTGSVQFSRKHDAASLNIQACVSHSFPASNKAASFDCSGMAAPALFRTSRLPAAAGGAIMGAAGMDNFSIPAFLRKQTGSATKYGRRMAPGEAGITPAEFAAWLNENPAAMWPRSYGSLRDLGLGLAICEWLELEIGQGHAEEEVVGAFIAVIMDLDLAPVRGLRQAVQSITASMREAKPAPGDTRLVAAIHAGLQGVHAARWPESVANFPATEVA